MVYRRKKTASDSSICSKKGKNVTVNMPINCLLLVLVSLSLCLWQDDALPRGFASGIRLLLAFHYVFGAALSQALHQTLGKTLVQLLGEA